MPRKKQKKDVKQVTKLIPKSAKGPLEIRLPRRQRGTRLELPLGEPDIEALRSVTQEWLVPRLVQKFLRMHGVELMQSQKLLNSVNRLQPPISGERAVPKTKQNASE